MSESLSFSIVLNSSSGRLTGKAEGAIDAMKRSLPFCGALEKLSKGSRELTHAQRARAVAIGPSQKLHT